MKPYVVAGGQHDEDRCRQHAAGEVLVEAQGIGRREVVTDRVNHRRDAQGSRQKGEKSQRKYMLAGSDEPRTDADGSADEYQPVVPLVESPLTWVGYQTGQQKRQ